MLTLFYACLQVALLDTHWPSELLAHPDGAEAWAEEVTEQGGGEKANYGVASEGIVFPSVFFAEVSIILPR